MGKWGGAVGQGVVIPGLAPLASLPPRDCGTFLGCWGQWVLLRGGTVLGRRESLGALPIQGRAFPSCLGGER